MKHVIHLGENPIVLIYKEIEEDIDVNEITRIRYDNLYGEAVTVSVMLNRIGQLRAEQEHIMNRKKFEFEIVEADLKKNWRREANRASGKFTITEEDGEVISVKLTEKSLEEAVVLDKKYQVAKNNYFKAQRDYGYLDSLFWSISDKSKKLNHLLPAVVPEDFYKELVEGEINGIFIKKPKK